MATNKYDDLFKKYTAQYFSDEVAKDANFQLWFKAQGITESTLNPNAVSPVNAKGLMQIMPATFKELLQKKKIANGDPFTPDLNVNLGIFYDKSLWSQWSSPRPLVDRLSFMFASYNGGIGNVLKAQQWAISNKPMLNANLQATIAAVAPNVKSQKYQESLDYVTRIIAAYKKLGGIVK